jgi:3-hydroxyacyl-CoA dehydrogenase
MNKKIAIIGAGSISNAITLELAKQGYNVCVLDEVVGSRWIDSRESEPFMITRLPEFKEPWIDPNEPVINYKKHKQACAKNRKKRKKRKRR